jgi:CBS domain-containing protein
MRVTASDVMTSPAWWIYEDAQVEDAAQVMMEKKVRRLVVKNHLGDAVGVITLDDVARFTHGSSLSGRILNEVARKPPQPVMAAMSAFDYDE